MERIIRMNRTLTATLQILYLRIRHVVPSLALWMIAAAVRTLDKKDPTKVPRPCSRSDLCHITIVFGLPCRHQLAPLIGDEQPIPLHLVDRYWHWSPVSNVLDNGSDPPALEPIEPQVVREKGRPKGSWNLIAGARIPELQSARHDPVAYEYAKALESAEETDSARSLPPSTAPA